MMFIHKSFHTLHIVEVPILPTRIHTGGISFGRQVSFLNQLGTSCETPDDFQRPLELRILRFFYWFDTAT